MNVANAPARSRALRNAEKPGHMTAVMRAAAAPLKPSRPQLPLSLQRGLASEIDWQLTIIAALSFLLHFGVIGSMYADWMDPIVQTDATVNGVIDLLRHIPPAPLEIPPEVNDVTTALPTWPATDAHAAPAPPKPIDAHPAPAKRMSAREEARLAAAAETIGFQTLGALTDKGTAVHATLDKNEIPTVDLGDAAGSIAGARALANNGLHFSKGGEPIRPGTVSTTSASSATRA